jgi:hypothetical protein
VILSKSDSVQEINQEKFPNSQSPSSFKNMISGISIELLLSKKELFDKASLEFSLKASLGDLPNKITKTFFLSMLTLLSNYDEK